ncbi:ATP-binding protein [Shewanella woodyi]|uniref:histidine kinase n=1 Tax=Shewanella woodyi (strain ATCC 51908 / MS32) TaxID=392500 RepID=B1KGJ4_SHEWM|nr:ATP-binding protein [Shewanella woodyi]ACA85322.1 integral membrane sensor signal transduction histidine kinase [Shewanella woodyi ATCC 51908]
MKRLFISLYLLISLSILGIGWTLDNIWQNNVEDSGAMDAPLIALAQLLGKLPEQERLDYLKQIDHSPNYPLELVDSSQIALSDHSALTDNSVLITTVSDHFELHFIKVNNQILVAGPIEIDPRARLRKLFTLLFYLSLGLIALIWVWPLSRDLKTLRNATQEFGQAKWDTQIELSPRSQVLPLATTFNEMAKQISSLIESQKHLSNAVSHEIRTPLARLKFALALMPQYCQPDSDEQRRTEFLEEMKLDVKEMENLLQELLTYASLESQQKEVNLEHCDLTALTLQTIKRLSSQSTPPIHFNKGAQPAYIMGDPSLIERAIQNLITNAQRFAQDAIDIKIEQNKQLVTLSVTNDGPGIPKEDQAKIFEPFYRSKSVQNGNKGHGLGLAIIKRIMERHQGEVELISSEEKTSFILTWPNPK